MDQFRPREDPNPVREIQRGVEDIKDFMSHFFKGRGILLIILIIVALYLASGIYIVGAGEKGVVLLFGKVHSLTGPDCSTVCPNRSCQTRLLTSRGCGKLKSGSVQIATAPVRFRRSL